MTRRYSDRALLLLLLLLVAFALTLADAARLRAVRAPALAESGALVRGLGLTDLCLYTEARYTRHPSQADLHSAFQDHPSALEHFPTGSIVSPPASLMHFLEAGREGNGRAPSSGKPEVSGKP